jgi:hypothetical protein
METEGRHPPTTVTRANSRLHSSSSISSERWSTQSSTYARCSGAPTGSREGERDLEGEERARGEMDGGGKGGGGGGGVTPPSVEQDVAGSVRSPTGQNNLRVSLGGKHDLAATRDHRRPRLSPKRNRGLLQSWVKCPGLRHLRQHVGFGHSRETC